MIKYQNYNLAGFSTTSPTPSVPESVNTSRYFSDPAFGITFSYPSNFGNYSLTSGGNYLEQVILENGDKNKTILIKITKYGIKVGTSAQQVVLANTFLGQSGKHPLSLDSFSTRKVAGYSYYFIANGRYADQFEVSYFLVKPDFVYEFSMHTSPVPDVTSQNFDPERNEGHTILKNILLTVK
jgi:hypothetical protein